MPTRPLACAIALLLLGQVTAQAEPAGSLQDARRDIAKGSAKGIVIWAPAAASAAAHASTTASPGTASASPAPVPSGSAPAASAASAPAGMLAAGAAAASALAARVGAALQGSAAAPGGLPLNAARRLDSPTLGIVIPTGAGAASQPAGSGAPKPGG